jgi:hypothetical protein
MDSRQRPSVWKIVLGRLVPAIFVLLSMAGCRWHRDAERRLLSPARLVDVADQAGLRYQWTIAGKRPLNILQTIGNGCAFLDYDNDGCLDILLVGPKLALYKGDGHGHFVDVTHQTHLDRIHGHLLGCAVGDYDNDGFDDIYLSGYRGGVLLHNDHGTFFDDVTAKAGLAPQAWGTSCAFVETVPGSGRLDLVICNYARFGEDKSIPQLCPFSGVMTSCPPTRYQPLKAVLYRNEGNGPFVDVSGQSGVTAGSSGRGLGVAAAPLDDSRAPYIALANDEIAGNLLEPVKQAGQIAYKDIGVSAGTAFNSMGMVHGGMGTDWGDFDNDGRLDLFVATFQHEFKSLYHNDTGKEFTDVTVSAHISNTGYDPTVAFGSKFADFTNDGWLDLIIANGHVQDNIQKIYHRETYRQSTDLYRNDHGIFVNQSATSGPDLQRPIVGRGLAVGDFDNDGRVDALVVDSEGKPLLLHNETPAVGHWLELTLVGTKSNRDGLGAVVEVTAGGLKQTRLCQTDGSYLSASDKRVHVGLGAATKADSVTVRWPSGHTDVFHNISADRQVTLREAN